MELLQVACGVPVSTLLWAVMGCCAVQCDIASQRGCSFCPYCPWHSLPGACHTDNNASGLTATSMQCKCRILPDLAPVPNSSPCTTS
jgi:hypothetical protein